MKLGASPVKLPPAAAQYMWVYLGVAALAMLLPFLAREPAVTVISAVTVVMALPLFAWSWRNRRSGQDQYALMAGAGSCPDNLVVKKHAMDAAPPDGAKEPIWPSFRDAAVDRVLYRSAAGFIVSPVKTGDELEPPKTLTIVPGGLGVRCMTALAGHESFAEARKLMAQQRGYVAEQLEEMNRKSEKPPVGTIHILANGFTNTAFFAESDIQKIETDRDFHVIFFVEGKGRGVEHVDELAAAVQQGLSKFRNPKKVVAIVTDNDLYATETEEWQCPMRVILMLSGAFGSSRGRVAEKADILHLPEAGRVLTPLRPKGLKLRAGTAGAPLSILQLKELDWEPMWRKLDRKTSWKDRKSAALLMAGQRAACNKYQNQVERELGVRPVPWAMAPVPGAELTWVCPLVPLTPKEMEGTLAGRVFGSLLQQPLPVAAAQER